MSTTTARMARFISRRVRLSDIFAVIACAAALAFTVALVFGLIG